MRKAFGFYRGKRVLVTGHTGFKGTWLCWLLAALGAEVYGYALPPQSGCLYEIAAPPLADACFSEIRDGEAVSQAMERFRPEVIFHLAAHSYIGGSYEYPAEIFEVNFMGTVRLLEAVRVSGRRIPTVVVTSDKCYSRQMDGAPCRETDPLGAAEAYSTSKACQDLAAQSYQYAFPEMAAAAARASNTIGGGDFNRERLIPYLLDCFAAGKEARLRSPGVIRPWQFVLDVLGGYLLLGEALAEARVSGEACYNFGPAPDGFQTVGAVAETLAKHFPHARYVWQTASAAGQTPVLRLDSSRASRELGWVPVCGWEEALAQAAGFQKGLLHRSPESLCREQTERYLKVCETKD